MSQHVPAWKKLGLKLKYAKDTADDAPVSTAPETNGTEPSHAGAKRTRDQDVEQDQGSAPKRNKQSAREVRTESPAPRGILSGSQSPTKTPANKKAVSFSAETKAEDGETGQNYFKAWAAGGQPHTPPKPSTEIDVPETPESVQKPSPVKTAESPAETKAKSKASKRDKKTDQAAAQTQDPNVESMPSLQERKAAKAAKKAAKQQLKAQSQPEKQQPDPSAYRPAYLDYLHQFHYDKPNWKFNKSKENHLLKSVWSTLRVPAPYTDALISYIAGLQGAGARTRLVEGADESLRDVAEKGGQKFDFNGYEESETRRSAYKTAVHALKDSNSNANISQDDFDRATHAEAVLDQLLNYAPVPVPVAKPTATKAAPAVVVPPPAPVQEGPRLPGQGHAKLVEGTAKRIQFDDDDDDEPAPAPAAKPKQPARRKRKARTEVSSDESSSDSSSSDSDSDSDSGDDKALGKKSSSSDSSDSDSDSD